MSDDKLLQACKDVWKRLQQFDIDPQYNAGRAIKLSEDIAGIMSNVHDGVRKYEFANAYLNEIRKSGVLSPRRTSVAGRSPYFVCCALYGLWAAMPLLIQEGTVGEHNLSAFVNFSYDLLDWVVGL